MTKIDIFSGFLGAGKTTLIKKLIQEAYKGEKLVLIENEFGEIGIDGGFMQEAGIAVNEMNSGCICCSLVGDFGKAMQQVIAEYHPDRILIEPSGVGKLSDVIGAVRRVENDDVHLDSCVTVADATKCKLYLKNFGEFYENQIEAATTIILSRTDNITPEKLELAMALLREHNKDAAIITTPWNELSGEQILQTMQQENTLAQELEHLIEHSHHDENCNCTHCHEDDHHHHHEHHHHDEDCDCPHCHDEHHHDHHEHHHHDEDCDCPHCHDEHNHDHHKHHHHHADEIFTSWGKETAKKYTVEEIREILSDLGNDEVYGVVLRAKGIVAAKDGTWIHFDFVPEEIDIRSGSSAVTGRLCVIGSKLIETAIAERFGV